ncbi:response regulator [Shewanella submarina]|uniref:Response regulator n=1 Tax=Shewanella submarina TaxID=2016376 RepID=A0ABV7GH48_9GAMM|nr:response regulator [Shewanella submarina]MCL1036527.1 response regulator [Shewanella submarina]
MALPDVSVLLVEDDPVFRKLVADFLHSRGAAITEACDGQDGIDKFQRADYDVVLADLSMPNLGGLDMLKEMSRLKPGTPSIVISGNNVMADVVEALRIGANDYLVKPVMDLLAIEQAIHQCLQHRMAQPLTADLEMLSHQELEDNLELLSQNAQAAGQIQTQLFPEPVQKSALAEVSYTLFKQSEVSAYFVDSAMIGKRHMMIYMAHFNPEDNRSAFASVLLRSFINQKLKAHRNGANSVVLEPYNLLCYLNDRLVKSGLDLTVDMIYLVVDTEQHRVAIAQAGQGLRCYIRNSEGIMPLAMHDSLQLGILGWGKPSSQFRSLEIGESLCIVSHAAEHKERLLGNRFTGLTYDSGVSGGGYIQLSLN